MTVPLLQVRNLHKHYGSAHVVNDVSLEVTAGECLGVIGPHGAGKTTTIRLCLGLCEADAGEIRYSFGAAASSDSALDAPVSCLMPQDALAIKARLGVVSQFDTLDPDFTCAENLRVYGRYFGLSDRAVRARIAPLLEFAALTHKAQARPGELSGGINEPSLLLLDEPTTGLDPQARHLMWERLQELLGQGKSILLTTHFMDEAERLCDRLLVLDHGRVIAQGRPRELIQQHLEPEVVEVYGQGAQALSGDQRAALAQLASRLEVSGDTLFFYTAHAQALLQALAQYPQLRTLHRPANLEDLFLKLTGRQMREES
jgi:lipooligosaccharide transport system ATP-binding protein